MNLTTIKCYCAAVTLGSKHIYQTVPRLLTLFLDLGAQPDPEKDIVTEASDAVWEAVKASPRYKVRVWNLVSDTVTTHECANWLLRHSCYTIFTQWYIAFPQMLSRVQHTNKTVYGTLKSLIALITRTYPRQALWLFAPVMHSTDRMRSHRGRDILDRVKVCIFSRTVFSL